MEKINDARKLGKRINNGDDTIEVCGDLANKVCRIKATGSSAIIVALGCVSTAIIAVLLMVPSAASGPGFVTDGFLASTTAAGAVAIWGVPVTITALTIGLGARNKNVIKTLYYDYDIVEKKSGSIILKRNKYRQF